MYLIVILRRTLRKMVRSPQHLLGTITMPPRCRKQPQITDVQERPQEDLTAMRPFRDRLLMAVCVNTIMRIAK